jgi:hypothetical protein
MTVHRLGADAERPFGTEDDRISLVAPLGDPP